MTFDVSDPRLADLARLIDERLGPDFDAEKRSELLVLEWARSEQGHELQRQLRRHLRVDDFVHACRKLDMFFRCEAFAILGREDFRKFLLLCPCDDYRPDPTPLSDQGELPRRP